MPFCEPTHETTLIAHAYEPSVSVVINFMVNFYFDASFLSCFSVSLALMVVCSSLWLSDPGSNWEENRLKCQFHANG